MTSYIIKLLFLCDEADFTSILSTIQDQYEFGHQVLADFLDGFDTYANFKEIIWDFVCTCSINSYAYGSVDYELKI